ncbi:hypothetical protein RhiirA1_451595 [Rhizophagus irregularis]|uniref:Uncharacterized protein n=1 Tax=Rhizophagus irregularis TaxID=588596 RepID=A0A2N0SC04_9GLOM|nr:hypothetical protein RhiirA1_451595 [Rhizophagus irregularis]
MASYQNEYNDSADILAREGCFIDSLLKIIEVQKGFLMKHIHNAMDFYLLDDNVSAPSVCHIRASRENNSEYCEDIDLVGISEEWIPKSVRDRPSGPKADQTKMFQTLQDYINSNKASDEKRKEKFLDFEIYKYVVKSDERKSLIEDLIGSFGLIFNPTNNIGH